MSESCVNRTSSVADEVFLSLIVNRSARLAQSVERKALNLVVVGSSPTVGVCVYPSEPLFFFGHKF